MRTVPVSVSCRLLYQAAIAYRYCTCHAACAPLSTHIRRQHSAISHHAACAISSRKALLAASSEDSSRYRAQGDVSHPLKSRTAGYHVRASLNGSQRWDWRPETHVHGVAFEVVRRTEVGAAVDDARADRVARIPAASSINDNDPASMSALVRTGRGFCRMR